MRVFLFLSVLLALGCPGPSTARLYHTEPKAPSLTDVELKNLDRLGATLIDKGVNFCVYSEHAERIEVLLFDDPESSEPVRRFPLSRFDNAWCLYVEGIGLGQYYGFIAWGPNWTYDPKWIPGAIDGFVADVDTDGNRFNPNKLLWDPYSKAIHRDHDWSKGSIATGPKRQDSTWAAASKSIVTNSQYTWSDHETTWRAQRQLGEVPGHRFADQIVYELHPKGFTASPASGVEHPGTFRGLGENAAYLQDLGVTTVHIMPVMEKPGEGGYWGYNTIGFFVPEYSYSMWKDKKSLTVPNDIIDEFKWMVDQLHQHDVEVMLDVVYNHTGEGGFWRSRIEDYNPDPATLGQLSNFDPWNVVGLYNFRGFDNVAYYATEPNRLDYANNTGVGNQSRPNYRPFRRLIIDSLRYWALEMHVDGFRFDLAPILGEVDDHYSDWDDPRNTVLQDIVDDPVLQEYNTRLVAEPWAAGAYDLAASYNGPPNNGFSNGYGTRIALFPSATAKPGTAWGEWNGRFRDWWRAFENQDGWNLNSTEVRNGGFFLTGSQDWFAWNGRRPYHTYNFVTVHDGFTMYDLFSYNDKLNGCGPLNPICCSDPTNAFCEKISGESNNRSHDWCNGVKPCPAADEAMKRQLMRNLYVALMVSEGTPLLYMGDEWMRTQLGNNNAYSTLADNDANWFDWGAYQAADERHRMHDFVKQVIRFRKEHAYAFAPDTYGAAAPFSWKSPQNTDTVNWNGKALMMHYYDGTKGPQLAILVNGETTQTDFTLPTGTWKTLVDTQAYFDLDATIQLQGKAPRVSNNAWLDSPGAVPGPDYVVPARSVVILQAGP